MDPWVGVALINDEGTLFSADEFAETKVDNVRAIPSVEEVVRFHTDKLGNKSLVSYHSSKT